MALDFSSELKLAARQIAVYINKDLIIPKDLLSKYDTLYGLVNGGGGGGSTTPGAITTGINDASNVDNIELNTSRFISRQRATSKSVLSLQSNLSTAITTPIFTFSSGSKTPSTLYIAQTAATTPHWVGFVETNAVPTTGAILKLSFYNSGDAGFQLLVDEPYFNAVDFSEFTVVRSSTGDVFTPLSAVLTAPSLLRITARGI